MIGPGYYQTCGQMLNESGASSSGTSGGLRIGVLVLYFVLVFGLCGFGLYMLDRSLSSTSQNKLIEVIDTNNSQYNNTHYNYHYGR